MKKRCRVKLFDENNEAWNLVMVSHHYPDVFRGVALKNIRATHFKSFEEAQNALEVFKKQGNKYRGEIHEI
nr:hypothetical protein [uncultured Allomuricauda sp.]